MSEEAKRAMENAAERITGRVLIVIRKAASLQRPAVSPR